MPEEEEQVDGIAGLDPGIEFPLSMYDRPGLGLSNLLARGDIDAMTRSFLSPQTLSPAEMRTFRSFITKGKKPGKVMKTILDVTTNPIFIMGILMSAKFPLNNMKNLHAIFTGAKVIAKPTGPVMSWVHAPFHNLRHVKGLYEAMHQYVMGTGKYLIDKGGSLDKAFKTAGRMNKAEQVGVGALMQGFNKATPIAGTAAAEAAAFMGIKGTPLAPGLQGKLRPELIKLAGSLETWLDGIAKSIGLAKTPNEATKIMNQVSAELKLKGLGGRIDRYAMRFLKTNPYEAAGVKSEIGAKGYNQVIARQVETAVAGSQKARAKGLTGLVSKADFQIMHDAGYLAPGVNDLFLTTTGARATAFSARMVEGMKKLTPETLSKWVDDTVGWMKKDFGVNLEVSRGSASIQRKTVENMGTKLMAARAKGGEGVVQEIGEMASSFANHAEYTLNVATETPKYLRAISNSQAWHIQGWGKKIMNIINTDPALKSGWARTYAVENLLPHVRGMRSQKSYEWASLFGEQKESIRRWIKYSPMFKHIPESTHKLLQKPFQATAEGIGYEATMGKVTNWFYLSTLGVPNLAPAFKNTLQTLITTTNMVGPSGMAMGYKKLAPMWLDYGKKLLSGVPREQAFKEAFPDFVKYTGDVGDLLDRLNVGDLLAQGAGRGAKVGSAWAKVKRGMLVPFSASETLHNRLVSFYAFSEKAMSRGMSAKAAGELGAHGVMHTQFSGGILGMPRAIMNLPAPVRQFAYFPLRFAGFLHGSVRLGVDPSKLDFGTIGRMLAGSTVAYHAGKNILGTDLSQGLMFGALPGPSFEGSPFFPSPFTPPAIAVVGSLTQALATGDPKYLKTAGALLTPGGIGLQRIHKTLAPRYADYGNRTPDGRIPLYGRNRALVGTFTPFQLVMRSFGITPTSMAGEWGGAKWLLTQREQLRGYRRDYLEALSHNDMGRAGQVDQAFQKQYPELGPLKIKKSDIRAVKNRREMSRLNRILKGFPSQYRPLFEQIATQAMTEQVFEDVKSSPQALQWYEDAARGL